MGHVAPMSHLFDQDLHTVISANLSDFSPAEITQNDLRLAAVAIVVTQNPEDGNAQYFTYRYWEHQQWCLALKADIVDAQKPRTRTPKDEIEAMQAQFQREC